MQNGKQPGLRKWSAVGPEGQTPLTQESQPEKKALYSGFKLRLSGKAAFPHSTLLAVLCLNLFATVVDHTPHRSPLDPTE